MPDLLHLWRERLTQWWFGPYRWQVGDMIRIKKTGEQVRIVELDTDAKGLLRFVEVACIDRIHDDPRGTYQILWPHELA